MVDLQGVEIKEESGKRKAAQKKARPSAKERARIRAEEIRAEMASRASIQPGDIQGGDVELYSYYHVTLGLPSSDRTLAVMISKGYEKCVDGEMMIGMTGGVLFRCPKEITDQRARER